MYFKLMQASENSFFSDLTTKHKTKIVENAFVSICYSCVSFVGQNVLGLSGKTLIFKLPYLTKPTSPTIFMLGTFVWANLWFI